MTPQITIHHVRETGVVADLHLYCGRKGGCKRTDLVDASLGNPFYMATEAERDRVCDDYEAMLMANHKHAHWPIIQRIGQRVFEGKSVALYCFCAPRRCHCESIKKHALVRTAQLRDPMNPFVPNR